MFFWKRGKKEEFSDEQIEKIIDEYMLLMKEAIGRYLPRRMRRALNKNKGWKSLSASKKREQLQDIRQKGLSSWLDQTTEEAVEQISSFVPESGALEEELRKILKDFKKKWNIR
ncbi:hypothetical protein DRJ04_06550 [Candidatus Aerophobetes bacterium]|uniref:Uncharacterized protein n=1 Tax=Aerophobetes bacterium TaxID=2030807 RepID=A0A662DD49_UNCAE|nr:MAG: hypothetical protein DRJ04_06550 [Candidatus Aerophobetes bacterium]